MSEKERKKERAKRERKSVIIMVSTYAWTKRFKNGFLYIIIELQQQFDVMGGYRFDLLKSLALAQSQSTSQKRSLGPKHFTKFDLDTPIKTNF